MAIRGTNPNTTDETMQQRCEAANLPCYKPGHKNNPCYASAQRKEQRLKDKEPQSIPRPNRSDTNSITANMLANCSDGATTSSDGQHSWMGDGFSDSKMLAECAKGAQGRF
jgi:hypothetical protein